MTRHTTSTPKKPQLKTALLAATMIAATVIAGVSVFQSSNAQAAAPAKKTTATTTETAPPPCPSEYKCVTIPCATSACPTVEAGPTANLGTNPAQYVFIKLYQFPAGDTPEIALCANTVPLQTAAPLCQNTGNPLTAPIFSDGSGFVSLAVPEDEKGPGQTPLPGVQLGNDADKGSFYCDNGPDLCALVVFDWALDDSQTPTSTNTAVIPVSYESSDNGCKGATLVDTESEFGIEGLLADANRSGCDGSHPALAFNTAYDSSQAVSAVTSGSVQIAFTDDPEAADAQAAIKGAGGHYAFIPIAASADVVGFDATTQENAVEEFTVYPQTTFDLTPNMVAGLTFDNSEYGGVTTADLLSGVTCANPGVGKPKTYDPCPGMESLNAISGFLPQEDYNMYIRSDSSGVNDEMMHWLCSAPDHTVPIDGTNETETDTARQLIEAVSWADSTQGTCPESDQIPALAKGNTENADSDPEGQWKALVAQVGDQDPLLQAVFAEMNWYEALYYGLTPAALQNAAGDFVLPSATSVDAALGDATTNPDGTLTYDYDDTSDAAAYPEPVVFYALVSTKAQPEAAAAAEKNVLENILTLTGSGSSSLPDGILPLTSSLAEQAEQDVAKDVVAAPPTPGKSTTPSNTGHTTTGNGSSSASSGDTVPTTSTTTLAKVGQAVGTASGSSTGIEIGSKTPVKTAGKSAPSKKKTPSAPKSVFHAVQVALDTPEWRWLLVGMLGAGAIAILAGPLLLALQRLRRKPAVRDGQN